MKSAAVLASVVAISVVPVLVARADDEVNVEKVSALSADGIAPMGLSASDFQIDEVFIGNIPDPGDIVKAQKEDPDDNCRPRINVRYTNHGTTKFAADFTVSLEDASAHAFLACEDKAVVSPGVHDYKNLCFLKAMKTIDWPKVARAHLKASVVDAEPGFDKVFPLAKGLAPMNQKLASVNVEEIVVQNQPNAGDLQNAAKDPTDKSHPTVVVFLSNPGKDEAKAKVKVRLEDKDGNPYVTCDGSYKLKPQTMSNDFTLCRFVEMKTRDWPKIVQAHVVASVER